ncbi:MAG: FGGY family carbohydrate kinase [Bacteroidales bacterium]|nr:FGGY family carbohydrate kinase [Bacteroidales bacterium]
MKYSLGIDVGSSSVKVSLLDIESGKCVASSTNPLQEMPIKALNPGWAEQDPQMWWKYICDGIKAIGRDRMADVKCIGITYQMHGLVVVDENGKCLRDSIIWCDSRAVELGAMAFGRLGRESCLGFLLNSPGNFTASKMAWVKENEPETMEKAFKFFLPGDYVAYRLSGKIATTETGLSEQILWNFRKGRLADEVLGCYGIPAEMVPETVPSIGVQAYTDKATEELLGIMEGTPISYRAGDQPNNAFSLNVMEPGEIAATAGTSGVVYGVIDEPKADPRSRVNTFLHVNHTEEAKRLGVLLCINGTGIMNAWVKRNFAPSLSYDEMNALAASVPPGASGVMAIPFGNGAERVLENTYPGAQILGLDLNRHSLAHVLRAVQEGIAFSFRYGIDIMSNLGLKSSVIRAGRANLFLSDVFAQTLSTLTGATIELYNTDGSLGAARGAALGAGYYSGRDEAFASLAVLKTITPSHDDGLALEDAYMKWKETVDRHS